MLSGTVVVDGNAGNGAAASIRGGTVVIHGSAAARAGIAMKGGTLVIGGDTGYMTGFMMQRGRIIVCGSAGPALADSMYEGVVFVGGAIEELGNDAVVSDASPEELADIRETLARYAVEGPGTFRKVISGRKLWNYDKKEREAWKAAF
jgi:glutamate synthase domain-containing protein 3